MKQLTRHFLLGVTLILFFATMVSLWRGTANEAAPLSMDTLANRVAAGEVRSIEVKGDALAVIFADGASGVAEKEPGVGTLEILRSYGVSEEALRAVTLTVRSDRGTAYWLGVILPTLLPLLVMIAIFWWIFRQAKTGASQAFSFGKITPRLFSAARDKVTFKDVAGLKETKQELEEVVDFLRHPKKFLDIGARIPRGVLLMGPPGTGKTLLARAVAGESNAPFFHLSASEFVEMFVGVGASRVRDLFQTAKRAAPSIIFIDEIDAVGRERGAGLGGGHDEREQTLNQILVEMDGFERDTNVIVMAATNRPDILDPALLRPGRFDRRVVLDMPDIADRAAILTIHAKGKPLEEGANLKTVAVRTPGFSGADLANLMNEAAIAAARENRKVVKESDILDSIEKVMLGPARRSRVISAKEKEITAYHEAGHALVAASLKDTDPVHKISIVARGMAGGYTLKLPTEERRLRTKRQFLADLAVAFGGYAAESATFGDISTGSSNDIRQATDLAYQLVTRYGMSERLGPRAFGKAQELIFLGREIASGRDYSEAVGTQIDEEVNKVIVKALATARDIVKKHAKALDRIAKTLMEKETIEQAEFEAMVRGFRLKPLVLTSF